MRIQINYSTKIGMSAAPSETVSTDFDSALLKAKQEAKRGDCYTFTLVTAKHAYHYSQDGRTIGRNKV